MTYFQLNELDRKTKFIGCSEEEVSNISLRYNHPLPEAYVEFLKLMGNQIDSIPSSYFRERGWKINGMKEAQKIIDISLNEVKLKETDIVFWRDEDGFFCFFNVLNGDNPPIWGFKKAQLINTPTRIANTFTEFIKQRRNGMNLPDIATDAILLKEFELATPIDEIKQKKIDLDLFLIPDEFIKIIEVEYDGKEREAVKRIAADFISEKSAYDNHLQGLEAMFALADGNIQKLNNLYLGFIFNHEDPIVFINELETMS